MLAKIDKIYEEKDVLYFEYSKMTELDKELVRAVERNEVEIATDLLQLGANPNGVRVSSPKLGRDYSMTNYFKVLDTAVRNKNPEMVELLLKYGADVDGKSSGGGSALHRAVSSDETIDIANILVKAGADIDSRSNDGYTPLMSAVSSGVLKGIDLLLENGADLYARSNSSLWPTVFDKAEDDVTRDYLYNYEKSILVKAIFAKVKLQKLELKEPVAIAKNQGILARIKASFQNVRY